MNKFRDTLNAFDQLAGKVESKKNINESAADTRYVSKMKTMFTRMEKAASLKEEFPFAKEEKEEEDHNEEEIAGEAADENVEKEEKKEEPKKNHFPFNGGDKDESEEEEEEQTDREVLEEILETLKRLEEKLGKEEKSASEF